MPEITVFKELLGDTYDVIESVEWALLNDECPMCFSKFPTHGLDCKLEWVLNELKKAIEDNNDA